jgi:hypothetical protein
LANDFGAATENLLHLLDLAFTEPHSLYHFLVGKAEHADAGESDFLESRALLGVKKLEGGAFGFSNELPQLHVAIFGWEIPKLSG